MESVIVGGGVNLFPTGDLTMKVEPRESMVEEDCGAPVQLDSLCRMCCRLCNSVASSSPALVQQLSKYFGIDVLSDDGLPKRVCCSCSGELSHWEQVRSSVEQAQTCLRQIRDNQTQEKCDVSDDVSNQPSESGDSDSFETVMVNPDITFDEKECYNCTICNKDFKIYKEYMEHSSFCKNKPLEKPKLSVCRKPSQKDYIPKKINDSIRPHSPNNPFICGICPMKFKSPLILKQHLNAHVNVENVKRLPCPHCNVVFKTINLLIEHQENHIIDPNAQFSYACAVCKKEFSTPGRVEAHMIVHETVRNFKCTMCSVTYKYKCLLDRHIKKHSQGLIKSRTIISLPIQKVPIKRDHTGMIAIAPKIDNNPRQLIPTTSNLTLPSNQPPVQYICVMNEDGVKQKLQNAIQIKIPPEFISSKKTVPNIPSTSIASNEIVCTQKVMNDVKILPHSLPVPLVVNVKNINDYPCGFCSEIFKGSESFTQHIEMELKKNKKHTIPCGYCGAIFRKLKNLLEHNKNHILHPDSTVSYSCTFCSKVFHTYNHFQSHSRTHSQIKNYKCTLCDAEYCHKVSLKVHIESQHGTTVKVVTKSDNVPTVPSVSGNALETVSNVPSNLLKIIPVLPTSHGSLLKPKEAQVKVFEQATEKLQNTSPQSSNNNKLFRRIGKTEHFACDVCNYKFFSPKFLYDHYLEKHIKNDDLNCLICNMTFEIRVELLKHLETHAVIRKHFCPICDRVFKQKSGVRQHLPLHSHERNFECEICSRKFRSRTILFYHIRNVHEEKKLMCEFCSSLFSSKYALKEHILRKHTEGMNYFECTTCHKTFSTKEYLRKHEYTHKETKPYRCMKCSKGFIDLYFYRLHLKNVCKIPEDTIGYFRQPFHN